MTLYLKLAQATKICYNSNARYQGSSYQERGAELKRLKMLETLGITGLQPNGGKGTKRRFFLVSIDVNGLSGPNIGGKDFFIFEISPTNAKFISGYFSEAFERIIKDGWKMNY